LHPDNRQVLDRIRQQLQVLRHLGFVEFLGRGRYRSMLAGCLARDWPRPRCPCTVTGGHALLIGVCAFSARPAGPDETDTVAHLNLQCHQNQ
jgi:hypothetical protein